MWLKCWTFAHEAAHDPKAWHHCCLAADVGKNAVILRRPANGAQLPHGELTTRKHPVCYFAADPVRLCKHRRKLSQHRLAITPNRNEPERLRLHQQRATLSTDSRA